MKTMMTKKVKADRFAGTCRNFALGCVYDRSGQKYIGHTALIKLSSSLALAIQKTIDEFFAALPKDALKVRRK